MHNISVSLRRLNLLYTLVQVMYWAAFATFSGFQTALLLSRGFSSSQAGMLAAARCLSGILSQPAIGGWVDRHPKAGLRRVLLVCLSLALAVNLLFYTTRPGFFGTALILLALGVVDLNLYPLLDSLAVQFINAGVEVNYSFSRGVGSFAYALACVLLGSLSAARGVEVVLVLHILFLAGLMAAVWAYPAPPTALTARKREDTHSLGELLRGNPAFARMLAAVFFAVAAVMPVVSFLVNIVKSRGGSETHLGVALFLMGASELPAALIFPRLWRRLGSRNMMLLSVVFMAAKPLVFLLTPSLPALLGVQLIQMGGYGLFTPASVYYANESVPAADRVRGQTVMMMASNGLGNMAGNLVAGFVVDWGGVNAMLVFCTILGAAGVLFALWAVRTGRKGAPVLL